MSLTVDYGQRLYSPPCNHVQRHRVPLFASGRQEIYDCIVSRGALRTACIRSARAPTGLPSYPASARNTQKEHYVQLGVIANAHRKRYGKVKNLDDASHLEELEEHFNQKGNLFSTSGATNSEKNNITQKYYDQGDTKFTISDDLRRYILEATPVVTEYIDGIYLTDNAMKKDLQQYVDWLHDVASNQP